MRNRKKALQHFLERKRHKAKKAWINRQKKDRIRSVA